jgi:hypothetical protein
MNRHPPHSRPLPASLRTALLLLGIGCATGTSSGQTADVPPELLGGFTRGVQPLLLNKCAAGACHGGNAAHEPRLRRSDVHGTIDRQSTLANLDTFLSLLGPDRDPQPLVDLLSIRHPREPANRRLVMKPLTPGERMAIESWAAALVDAERAVRTVDYETTEERPAMPPRPNRFRVLLDTGTPPLAPREGERTGRTDFAPLLDGPRPAAIALKPESGPPSPPRGTDGSPPERPDGQASPPPTSRESR